MKYLLTAITMSLILSMQPAEVVIAQDIDANRMNRDIRVMENIIGELFKTQNATRERGGGNNFVVNSFSGGASAVKGTYLPGYGVIFDIKGSDKANFILVTGDNEEKKIERRFYYNSDGVESEDGEAVNQENLTRRMGQFLKDYGSTIGQLKGDEQILLIYGDQKNQNRIRLRVNANYSESESDINDTKNIDAIDVEKMEKKDLPVISLSVKAKDLQDYRRGKLDEAALDKRFEIATSDREEKLDLKVMEDIFESALSGKEGPHFRMMGRSNHLVLDNFGAIFSFDVRYSLRGGNSAFGMWSRRDAERLAEELRAGRGRVAVEIHEERVREESDERENRVSEAYDMLIKDIKEYLVDYGRTLSSVEADQYVLVSVSINGRYEDVPERLEIQVSKSVLEDMDRGKLSREKALEQVIVNEY